MRELQYRFQEQLLYSAFLVEACQPTSISITCTDEHVKKTYFPSPGAVQLLSYGHYHTSCHSIEKLVQTLFHFLCFKNSWVVLWNFKTIQVPRFDLCWVTTYALP